jgi:hypothetical protein
MPGHVDVKVFEAFVGFALGGIEVLHFKVVVGEAFGGGESSGGGGDGRDSRQFGLDASAPG